MSTASSHLPRILSGLLVCISILMIHSNAAGQQPVVWESDFGSDLSLSDDSTSSVVFGSFVFPFAGDVFTGSDILDVSSNGFVSVGGSNGDDCCNGDIQQFLNDPFARIAPLWADIDPANVATDGVFINSFNDDGDAADDRLVVTWDAQHWGSGEDVLFQLQLLESGTIVFGYNGVSALDRDTLIGIGTGGGAIDPGSSDLAEGGFSSRGSNIYEFIPIGFTAPDFDLDFSNVVFSPISGTDRFAVTSSAVPEPSGLGVLAFACSALFTRRRR